MLFHHSMWSADCDDSTLVSASVNGDREAFGQIVSRYQALVASVAYSATGSLTQSEDLAQETFLAAWKQLKSLQEPGKLRSWLYGIARRVAANSLRRQQREPVQRAAPLEVAIDTPAPEALPVEGAITHEEEAILWRSLGQIPETYREPLILFYRENQSVECVARSLGLSEEAVRQRLSRGRKLLEERVTAFVEGALRQSVPGPSFTLAVLGALPAPVTTIGTVSAGAAAAKASATSKAAGWLGVLNSFAGVLVGFLAAYLGYKTDMADATSARQRYLVRRFYGVVVATVLFSLGLLLLAVLVPSLAITHPGLYASLALAAVLSWVPPIGLLLLWLFRVINAQPSANFTSEPSGPGTQAAFEYRSRASLLGLPLVHIRFGGTLATRRKPVKGWVAMGEVAFGGLFAAGGIAVAPLAVGGFAFGGVLFGGFGAGIVSYAGFALGLWAIGGLVCGFKSIGGCAIGWKAAAGGIAIARQFAQGGVTVALHAGDALAQAYFHDSAFFNQAPSIMAKCFWPVLLLTAFPAILTWHWGRRRHRP